MPNQSKVVHKKQSICTFVHVIFYYRVTPKGYGPFNATFNNISVISWWSVLLVEETREPGENHRLVTSHWPISYYHIRLYQVHLARAGFELKILVVKGSDYIGSNKSNYHTTTTTAAPYFIYRVWKIELLFKHQASSSYIFVKLFEYYFLYKLFRNVFWTHQK